MSHCGEESDGLISVDEAFEKYSAHIQPLPIQEVALAQAHGRILAEDVFSQVDLPLFTQSAVDGYALKQSDIEAGVKEFSLSGEVRAGSVMQTELFSGQAMRIFTGGRLPAGADTVARQEIVEKMSSHIRLTSSLSPHADIRYRGEELKIGSCLAPKGKKVTAGLLAACAMAGVKTVRVYQSPRIAIVITGDEVSKNPDHEAQIYDANGPLITTWLAAQGVTNFECWHVGDNEQQLREVLAHVLNQYDVVLTTGGVSVGDYDLVRPLSQQVGAQEIFWRVAQKPGKPLYFAEYKNKESAQTSYLMGLPGNPAAVFISLPIHVQTVLNLLQGLPRSMPQWQKGWFSGQLRADSRERFLRVQLGVDASGRITLSPLPKQQSHMLSNLAHANALVRVPANKALNEEALLPFLYFA
jgi:molybdopterin molybdotransferase